MKLLLTFLTGTSFGIYVAQNYNLPDIKTFYSNLYERLKKLEQDTKKQDGTIKTE